MVIETKQRQIYSPEFKANFVVHCLTTKGSFTAKCKERGIAESVFYGWRKIFIDAGISTFRNERKRTRRKISSLQPKLEKNLEHEFRLKIEYLNLLRTTYPSNARLPAKVKQEIIELVEQASIPKIKALELTGISKTTYYNWLKVLRETGNLRDLKPWSNHTKVTDRQDVKEKVFEVLHTPPSDYGFNRTTWKFNDLQQALAQSEVHIGQHSIRKIIRDSGHRWLKAKKVLTSKDPDYREKLDHIHGILSSLRQNEGFFSIDEYGPFAVKRRQGKKLVAAGEAYTVPQWQKSKGCLIMTAALELSTNQVTHFYSEKKDTEEMIKLLDILLASHSHLNRIYLSWDAASWHISKKLFQKIEDNNVMAYITGSTHVDVAPLPAGAQFLNVIESIFSGMARAIIHNSDYKSKAQAQDAIDRYFAERNQFFRENPKRAGKKIWGKERVPVEFSESHNCKDPMYR